MTRDTALLIIGESISVLADEGRNYQADQLMQALDALTKAGNNALQSKPVETGDVAATWQPIETAIGLSGSHLYWDSVCRKCVADSVVREGYTHWMPLPPKPDAKEVTTGSSEVGNE